MKSTTEYSDAVIGLNEFGLLLCSVIKELLTDAGIQIHSITYRVKDYDSAVRKLNIKSDRYRTIGELTDLLGVRIITYFPTDVDDVAAIIQKEFRIDSQNSIDKRKSLPADRFGYLSLHYVATLPPKRSRLVEYKRYKGKPFELQVRSILQHAWAEIEHDLGYKAEGALPNEVQRRFFRLAGSLELADEEFERLRNDIDAYEKHVDDTINYAPQTLRIDQSTVVSALKEEKSLISIDDAVAGAAKRALREDIDAVYVGRQAKELRALGIDNIGQLINYADIYQNYIAKFVEYWLMREDYEAPISNNPLYRGIGLFYLGYVIAAQLNVSQLQHWGQTIRGRKKGLLKNVHSTWDKVVHELGPPPSL